MSNYNLILVAAVFIGAGCSGGKNPGVPALSDEPVLAQVQRRDLPEYAPGYGIAVENDGYLEFEVNIEAEDAPLIHSGERALAYLGASTAPVHCQVSRILRAASSETGQAIAWLKPVAPMGIPAGAFLYANITTRIKRDVLVIPESCIFMRDGRTWAIRAEKTGGKLKYSPVEVTTGILSEGSAEIKSGLSAQDQVAVQGGIGFLYPDFKAAQEDD